MKLSFAAFVLCSLLLCSTFMELATATTPTPPSTPPSSFCPAKCNERCKKAAVNDRCLKYCGICCRECKCVPSGTYGNKHECPCYRDKVNKKGKPKCP